MKRRGLGAKRKNSPRNSSWDKDIISTIEEDYLSFSRGLSWREGFGVEFVNCSPESGKHLIKRIRKDLSNKKIDVLILDRKIDNLINLIASFPNQAELDILFVVGLEKSLEDYIRKGYGGEGDYYNFDSIPPILSHINWQRENFRDRFPHLCFVFLLPKYALKYVIRRAPDFFDWSSGSFDFEEFTPIKSTVKSIRTNASSEVRNPTKVALSPNFIVVTLRLILLIVLIFFTTIAAAAILTNLPWYVFLVIVFGLVIWRILAFVQENSWVRIQRLNGQGVYLSSLGRHEEAVSVFDQVLRINSKLSVTWKERGDSLDKLGRYEEAVISFDKALEIEPDDHEVWNNRGIALLQMGKYDEAIQSIDRSIKIRPDSCAYESKAYVYVLQDKIDLAIENLLYSVQLDPTRKEAIAKDSDLDNIRHDPRFQALIQ